jgi:hypothetical protein
MTDKAKNKSRWVLAAVACNDEYVDQINVLAVHLSEQRILDLKECVKYARAGKAIDVFKVSFEDYEPDWIVLNDELSEELDFGWGSDQVEIYDELPEFWTRMMDCIDNVEQVNTEIPQLVVYPDGDIKWECYLDGAQAEYFTGMVNIERLEADLTPSLEVLARLWHGDLANATVDNDSNLDRPLVLLGTTFPAGTHNQEVWHWFEDQNPAFVVQLALQGRYRNLAAQKEVRE